MTPSKQKLQSLEGDVEAALESHDRGRDLDAFGAWEDDPIGFGTDVLGVQPWSAQQAILEAVRDHPQVIVHGGNAVGKDFAAACAALWWVFCRRGLVLATAAVERQAVDVFMHRELGRLWRRAPDLPGTLRRSSLQIPNREKIGVVAFTSTEASKLTGYHAPRVMAVATEAQGLDDFAWEGLQASATGSEDRFLAVGNPITISGRFRALAESPGWRAIGVSTREHPNVAEGRTVIPGGPSPDFEARMRRDWGEDSPVFVARVLGEFPSEEPESMFRRAWLDAASSDERWRALASPEDAEPLVAVDVARHGADDTVAAVRVGDRIVGVTFGPSRADTTLTTKWLDSLCRDSLGMRPRPVPEIRRRHRHAVGDIPDAALPARGWVRVDAVGIGAGVADQMRERRWRVEDFKGSRRAADPDLCRNRRSEAYWTLARMLEAGGLALPDREDLRRELLATRWSPDAQGRVAMEGKDAVASRVGGSPDVADAVAMVVAPEVPEDDGREKIRMGVWSFG